MSNNIRYRKTALICFTANGKTLGRLLSSHFKSMDFYQKGRFMDDDFKHVENLKSHLKSTFHHYEQWIFIGSLGICVRSIAIFLSDKKTDPAVINIDEQGHFTQCVIGAHRGGNELTAFVSKILSATPILSTSSDLQGIWSLDTFANRFKWKFKTNRSWSQIQGIFVAKRPTALLMAIHDKGTDWLQKTCPDFVTIISDEAEIEKTRCELLIYVGYRTLDLSIPYGCFYPPCLSIGSGCNKNMPTDDFETALLKTFNTKKIAIEAVADLNSIDLKAEEQAYVSFCKKHDIDFKTYPPASIQAVKVPTPSDIVQKKIGVDGVAESCSALGASQAKWLLPKTKIHGKHGHFTLAVSLKKTYTAQPFIWIVGAGSGDPELLTIKGKQLLEKADFVLYAGSLVPEQVLQYVPNHVPVANSATMTLETQMQKITHYYEQGKNIVRLHSGDPAIYGAVQEQMRIFDEKGYDYAIVPGISAFQAAAAYLRSELTIPQKTQTIILTRGAGKTPMPEKENLENIAKLQASLCIYLSAGIAKKIQMQLLKHYPKDTPTAIVYRIGWEDEKVWRSTVGGFADIIKEHQLKRTVLIMVGDALGARTNRSNLYDGNWQHIFRRKSVEGN